MIELMAIGVVAYFVLMPIINRLIDNRGDLDLDEENRLTERYK